MSGLFRIPLKRWKSRVEKRSGMFRTESRLPPESLKERQPLRCGIPSELNLEKRWERHKDESERGRKKEKRIEGG